MIKGDKIKKRIVSNYNKIGGFIPNVIYFTFLFGILNTVWVLVPFLYNSNSTSLYFIFCIIIPIIIMKISSRINSKMREKFQEYLLNKTEVSIILITAIVIYSLSIFF